MIVVVGEDPLVVDLKKIRGIYFIPQPCNCDRCGRMFGEFMYDAAVKGFYGDPWGCMCETCFKVHKGRLGLGLGQKYEQREDGKFWQIEGGSHGTT